MSAYSQRRYGSRRSSFRGRLLIALVLVVISLVSFFSSGQINPITGERQRVAMSAEQEIAMGLQAAPEMAQQHGGLHPDRRGAAARRCRGREIGRRPQSLVGRTRAQ